MRNLTMMTDLYQLTMMYGYYRHDMQGRTAVFDLFFRTQANGAAYAIAAGLDQAIDYIENIHFDADDLAYLRSLNLFDEGFLSILETIRFTGEIYAMPEGTVAFAGEPLLRVTAPIMEAQLVETALLNIVNHQTLIATKASRVAYAAQGDAVIEFGLRRAQGPDAGIYGARAAMIGGCVGTSNVFTGEMYGIPIKGTHAHSWVMSFPSELEAFRAYARTFPDACLLLVDTYDTLRSGIPNAIQVFRELRDAGHKPIGIRLDSGDLAYLSKRARAMMAEAGFPDVTIFASNDLDEYTIWDLKAQGAEINTWGVGTKLITSGDNPALGGVYKLVAEEDETGALTPRIKISESLEKTTIPGCKKVYRIYDQATDKALADLICLEEETLSNDAPLTIFHPDAPYKRMTIENYYLKELLVPVFVDGKCVYTRPTLQEIQAYAAGQMDTLWEEYKRLNRPHEYKVDFSQALWDVRQGMLHSV